MSFKTGTAARWPGTLTTDREGDGARARDPLETEVVVVSGGEVRIIESPIAVTAPQGYQSLTQQVNISAPEGSANDPLILRFSLDATRMEPDMTLDDLVIFQDGDLVPSLQASNSTPKRQSRTLTYYHPLAGPWRFSPRRFP